jgi:hypothetical protein
MAEGPVRRACMGRAARKVAEMHPIAHMADQYVDLFEQLQARKRVGA